MLLPRLPVISGHISARALVDSARELGGSPARPHRADDIDKLVDESLKAGNRGGTSSIYKAKCEKCGWDWHGFARRGCPGVIGKPIED